MTDVASSETKVQIESIQYNRPTGEASMSAIAALANFMREVINPVGTVVYSMLDETTFQAQTTSPSPVRWILADGRDVSGSAYEDLTGNSNAPDLRGVFVRGKNGARSGTTGNPDGDLALGTFKTNKTALPTVTALTGTTDSQGDHTHTVVGNYYNANDETAADIGRRGGNPLASGTIGTASLNGAHTHGVTLNGGGDNETAPRNVTMNAFIRIN